jgi:FAD/FMN-containing dehydrogenase
MSTIRTAKETTGVGGLRELIDGHVVLPGEEGWDLARRAWNLAADQRPVAVAFAESAADVVAIVDFARVRGLRVATQATGHFAGSLDGLEDTILVKTSRMRGLEVDPETRTARAEAGVLWEEVTLAAAEHGLAGLAGSSPDVGVVGYTLGGGLGWLARRYGLAANSVLAVEVVTADGRLVRADRDTEPDLFWAVRGGGCSFGIVTAIEFALYPVAEVYAGILFFPAERAAEVLNAWSAWVEETPEEITSAGRLMQFPPIPDVPEPLRGRSFVMVEAA